VGELLGLGVVTNCVFLGCGNRYEFSHICRYGVVPRLPYERNEYDSSEICRHGDAEGGGREAPGNDPLPSLSILKTDQLANQTGSFLPCGSQ
jgi:hypothetical protein